MPIGRTVFQAHEKVRAMHDALHRAGSLLTPNMKSLALAADIPYSTLKSAVRMGRFSLEVETALSKLCGFDLSDPSWVDELMLESKRRERNLENYAGRDTVEKFRDLLSRRWAVSADNFFESETKQFSAFDPHMARHEISDCGQKTPSDTPMQFFITAFFQPFYHRSGLKFGFRKAVVTLHIDCEEGAFASQWLGHPEPINIRNAQLSGEPLSHHVEWRLECLGDEKGVLEGEYSSTECPLFSVADFVDGSSVRTLVEVNMFDSSTFGLDAVADVSDNKMSVINQIFSKQLSDAEDRNGWITLSHHSCVIARYQA